MKALITFLALILALTANLQASADELQYSQREGAVAYVARVKTGMDKDLAATATGLDSTKQMSLAAHGINNLQLFTEFIGDDRVLLASFDMTKDSDPDASWIAATNDPALKPWLGQLQSTLAPHPRDQGIDHLWARCETLTQLRPRTPNRPHAPQPAWSSAVTGLKLEKEESYRNLHSHVWPGVIDAIGGAMISRFDLFLVEFGDQPYLFYQMRYIGTDLKGDMASMAANPVNKRWWKWTDACQWPLPSAASRQEIWEPMEPAAAPAPRFNPVK